MLDLLLREGKRRGQEAEQWRGRADKAEQQLQEAQQLIREYQKVNITDKSFGSNNFFDISVTIRASYSIIIVHHTIPLFPGFLAVFRSGCGLDVSCFCSLAPVISKKRKKKNQIFEWT
jgi:hypothetical protein